MKAVRQVVAMRKDTALERADVPIVVVLLLVDVVNRSIVVHWTVEYYLVGTGKQKISFYSVQMDQTHRVTSTI